MAKKKRGKSKTQSYAVMFELSVSKSQEKEILKYIKVAKQIYNAVLGEALKRINSIRHDMTYINLMNERRQLHKEKDRLEKDKENKKTNRSKIRETEKKLSENAKLLNEIKNKYNYSQYALQKYAGPIGRHFNLILSNEVQVISDRAFEASEKILYGKAKKVHFKNINDIVSVQNKSCDSGLRYKDGYVIFGRSRIKVIIPKNNKYIADTFFDRTKFIRIKAIKKKNGLKFYIDMIKEGIPPSKGRTTQEGEVGIDIGTSTVAVVSDSDVSLIPLADTDYKKEEKEIRKSRRKVDRSKRKNNPNKYNGDGTFKKGNKDKWVISNRCRKELDHLANLQRVQAAKRKTRHEKTANEIVAMGNTVRVEKMCFAGLKKRKKKTTVRHKDGKINSKKGYGKSISKHAPALLITIIDRKLRYCEKEIIKINTKEVKASQYSHETDTYTPKPLSQRYTTVFNSDIQRDLYSAFLIQNVVNKDGRDVIDREKCFIRFNEFKKKHYTAIERIRNNRLIYWNISKII